MFPVENPAYNLRLTEHEIVNDFLKTKLIFPHFRAELVTEIDDLASTDPSTLPGQGKHRYFFSKKFCDAVTMSRYWTPIGRETQILDPKSDKILGIRQTLALVHTDGKMPSPINKPTRSWFMYEYRLAEYRHAMMYATCQQELALYHLFPKKMKTYDSINDDGENNADIPDRIDRIALAEDSSAVGPPLPSLGA